jgi:hypothetical protein
MLTSYNEHIVIRQARDSRCLMRMLVQCFPADVVNYFNNYVMNVWHFQPLCFRYS